MRTHTIAAAAALFSLLFFSEGAQAQQTQPPVDAFGQLPEISQPSLSPDGKHFAAIQTVQGRPAAVIYTVGGGAPPVAIPSAEQIIEGVQWAKNDKLLVRLRTNVAITWSNESDLLRRLGRIFVTSLDGSERTMLMQGDHAININSGINVDDVDVDDADHVYVSLFNDYQTGLKGFASHSDFYLTLY